jgi:hypothetical protein
MMTSLKQTIVGLRRNLYFLWDVTLLVGATLVLIFPTVRVLKQREHRAVVARMAVTLVEHKAERVALPFSMRPEVPQLLKKGISPVLYDPVHTAAQQFSLLNVTYKIQGDPPSLTQLDLNTLRTTPISPGQSIREEFSRPYIYSPIQPSFKLTSEAPIERSLFLAPGRYELNLEVFSKQTDVKPTVSIVVTVGGAVAVRDSFSATRIVYEPARIPFTVPSPGGHTLLIVASSGPVFVHAWELEGQ